MYSMDKPKICEGECVPKGWGEEIIIANNKDYCGKVLVFNDSGKFSMHYHMIKDETWYVEKGRFVYRWIDTDTAEVMENLLKPGDVVRQRPGQPHQLECLNGGGRIFEVSTEHKDSDSYRVMPGDSQKNKVTTKNPFK